ncbi:MAG: acyloxyacyl hydrolase [Bacteroidetes bacterium]|nr:acyloxyacyl hydrolase [Bacteroidota bacterium]
MPRRYTKVLLIITAMMLHGLLRAQEAKPWSGLGIELNQVAGKVFKHTSNFHAPVPSVSAATDLNFVFHTFGRKDWEQRRHYPVVGIGLTYTAYGLDSIYGRCFGIYPNLQVPVIKGKRLEWTIRFGLGIGYVTRHYSTFPRWDTLNNAIGSHINNFTMFATDLRYHVNDRWDVQIGANFSHISDGSFRQPNLGVNMYGGHLGFTYYPVARDVPRIVRNLQPLKNRWEIQARLGMSFNSYKPNGGPLYPVYLASLYTSKRYASRNKAFLGIDYSYHKSVYAFLKNNEIFPGQEAAHAWKSGLFVGNEFLLGRFGLVLQVGYYLKRAYLKEDPYYEKLGYNFYLIEHEKGPLKELSLYSMLKTHKVVAELIEFGISAGL